MLQIKYPLILFFASFVMALIAALLKVLNISGNNMLLAITLGVQVLALIWLFAALLRLRG